MDELVKGEYLDAYSVVLEEFFRVFAEEERKFFSGKDRDDGYVLSLSRVLRENWTSGKFWYFHALDNPKVCCNLYFQHIQPMVAESLDDAGMATSKVSLTQSLERGALETITAKLKDRKVYEDQLRKIFEDRSNMAGDLCYLGE